MITKQLAELVDLVDAIEELSDLIRVLSTLDLRPSLGVVQGLEVRVDCVGKGVEHRHLGLPKRQQTQLRKYDRCFEPHCQASEMGYQLRAEGKEKSCFYALKTSSSLASPFMTLIWITNCDTGETVQNSKMIGQKHQGILRRTVFKN